MEEIVWGNDTRFLSSSLRPPKVIQLWPKIEKACKCEQIKKEFLYVHLWERQADSLTQFHRADKWHKCTRTGLQSQLFHGEVTNTTWLEVSGWLRVCAEREREYRDWTRAPGDRDQWDATHQVFSNTFVECCLWNKLPKYESWSFC